MTIKELCLNNDCRNCPFYSICMRIEENPENWNEYTNKIITKAIIETSKLLLEVDND